MLKVLSSVLMIACAIALSCQAQVDAQNKQNKELTTVESKTEKEDPYFAGYQSIVSESGPETITRNILQDRNGYYWLATWDGIIGYDGKTFTNYTNKEGLRRFRVFSILEDRQGILWFGTIGAGVYRYDGKTFENLTMKDGLADDRVTDIYEDKEGVLWFSTTNGISRYDRVVFTNHMPGEKGDNNDINSIVQGRDGTYFIGTRGETFTFDGKNFESLKHSDGNSFYNVRRMMIDADGLLWFGGNDGLWTYNSTDLTKISDHFTGYVYQDAKGNIWTSAVGDHSNVWVINKISIRSMSQRAPEVNQVNSAPGMYFGIVEDAEGNIIVGSLEGAFVYDGKEFVKW